MFLETNRLYITQPWEVYDQAVLPAAFEPRGLFQELLDQYEVLKLHYRKALWEASHCIPITIIYRRSDPDLARFYIWRKQRQSRSGLKWNRVLPDDT